MSKKVAISTRDDLIDRLIEEDPSITDLDALSLFEKWLDDAEVLYWLIVMLHYRRSFVGVEIVDQIARTAQDEQLAGVSFLFCVRAGHWFNIADWPANIVIETVVRDLGRFFASDGVDGGISFTGDAASRSRVAAAVRWGPCTLREHSLNAVLEQLINEDDRSARSVMVRTVRELTR